MTGAVGAEPPTATPAPGPLDGMLVLDFSQFLAGPVAAMRLGDLGARVIKIERPDVGDLGRTLAFGGIVADGDTLSFHIMNRNKESLAADLKDARGLALVRALVARADVLIQNFRPGVMERIGLDYPSLRGLNPRLVYGSVTGFGDTGPWRDRPGQDLLAQSISGLPWLNGQHDQGPVPVGLSVADLLASVHLAHGVTALLLRRERTGLGGLVETSLLEGMLDLQFELLSAHLTDPQVTVRRGGPHGANAFLSAPYGTYPTSDGYLALAMNPVPRIGELIGLAALARFTDPQTWWSHRVEIEGLLATHLATEPTQHWLDRLDPAGVWCAPVLTLPELVRHEGFTALRMAQQTQRAPLAGGDPVRLTTTRSPLRIDGQLLTRPAGSPRLGEHTTAIEAEFGVAAPPARSA
ncbi:MAG TPA: CaiB/BaiF CoA-transferase family protein [Mycobacteriales bacterium]|nr:CaiB/BaiF CoA-transferase family protein [Mycobacteriales bacterium]